MGHGVGLMAAMREDPALFLSPGYDKETYLAAESLGLRTVAALLERRGADVRVVEDCPVPLPPDISAAASNARLVGIGVLFTRQIPDAIELARALRKVAPDAHLTIGGQGLQFLWRRVLDDCPEFDSACMHEGDETLGELWQAVLADTDPATVRGLYGRRRGAVVSAGVRPPVEDLDSLPFPYRERSPDRYLDRHATMSTSRGCAAHCTFCQSGNYGNRYHRLPRWRSQSAGRIVDELSDLVRRYGITAISFVDDDFLGGDGRGRDRAFEFAEHLARLPFRIKFSIECRINELDEEVLTALRDVGLSHVLIGVESANEHDIAIFAKKTTNREAERAIGLLRRLDIDFSTGFIMFQPLSDVAGIEENLRFLARNRIGAHRRIANRLELYPGAPLLSYFQRRGVEFREERYRLYYRFRDDDVAALYVAFRDLLAPFAAVEESCQAALFRAVTSGGAVANGRIRGLKALANDIASALMEAAARCVHQVVAGSDPTAVDEITAAVRRSCADLTASIDHITCESNRR